MGHRFLGSQKISGYLCHRLTGEINDDNMDNKDNKKKPKKKDETLQREHKQPWQERYATPEEIKQMLDSRVSLRYNEVRGRTEIHYYSRGPSIRADEQGLLTIFGGDEAATDGYRELGDRDVNSDR